MVRRILFLAILTGVLSLYGLPQIQILGNVVKPYTLREGGNLDSLLTQTAPGTAEALLIASDGTAVRLYRDTFAQIRIEPSNNGWESRGDNLPPVCDLNNIVAIAVERSNRIFALRLLDGLEETEVITPYAAVMKQFAIEGTSSRNGKYVTKYKSVASQWSIPADSTLVLDYKRPEYSLTGNVRFDRIRFTAQGDTVVGLWKNPPAESIYSLHGRIAPLMKEGPLLMIFVDSFGLRLRDHCKATGERFALLDYPLQPMRAAYPPVTAASYWAVGTGESYYLRGDRTTILSDILPANTNGIILEDSRPLYQAPVPVVANTDRNNNGTIDDDIYQAARAELDKGHQFMLVHFHSIDDAGHEFGPYSPERLARAREVSGYVDDLVQRWNGPVIVFSDHGMHDDGRHGGTHGISAIEDMLALWGRIK
jgi:hypothetical protein